LRWQLVTPAPSSVKPTSARASLGNTGIFSLVRLVKLVKLVKLEA
jgi:hypothetical protein